ncbi:MAG: methionyl-tRNA formyltransferase [Acinetobacter sp.]|nr:methionyl-tRNA formyltransferase [Acinetobacter sp.]
MRIIFAGTPDFAAEALKALLQTSHDIVAVYTQPDRKAGRGQKLTASPVKQVALEHQIAVYQPTTLKSSSEEGLAAQQQLQALNADVMVVAAYGLILPQAVLDLPKYGCLNIHASLLPRWRGAAPIQRAILAGDDETGITIMQMAAGLDTGDMMYKTSCPILAEDHAASLHDKLAAQGAEAICQVLASEAQLQHYQQHRQVQDDALSNYATKLSKDEACVDWTATADEIHRQIRAFYGWPVAFCRLSADENLRLWSAQVSTQYASQAACGEVVHIDETGTWVQCGGNTTLQLTSVQWAGGKPFDAKQIWQSGKLSVGQNLQFTAA